MNNEAEKILLKPNSPPSRNQLVDEMYKIRENVDNMLSKMHEDIEKNNSTVGNPSLLLPDPETFQIHVIEEENNDVLLDKSILISFTPKKTR